MNQLSWETVGVPAPQGSKKHVGRGIMVESCKALPSWRQQVIYDINKAAEGETFLDGVGVVLVFRFPRLKAHYNSKGKLKPNAPSVKTSKPDIDKLCRAVLDAMTISGVIKDDSRCHSLTAYKVYCQEKQLPGVSGLIKPV